MTKIINRAPPNYRQILNVFPIAANNGVIFAYHDAIYNPSGGELPPELIAHEEVHLQRQGYTENQAIKWWNLYLRDEDFRYNEELLAHRAEYLKSLEIIQTTQEEDPIENKYLVWIDEATEITPEKYKACKRNRKEFQMPCSTRKVQFWSIQYAQTALKKIARSPKDPKSYPKYFYKCL